LEEDGRAHEKLTARQVPIASAEFVGFNRARSRRSGPRRRDIRSGSDVALRSDPMGSVGVDGPPVVRPEAIDAQSAVRLFEVVDDVKDAVGGRPQATNGGAVVGVVLTLEDTSGIVDVTETLNHFLTLGVSDPEDTVDMRHWRVFKLPGSRFTVAMLDSA